MSSLQKPLTAAEITKATSLVAQGVAPRIDLRDSATPGLRLRVGRRAAVWDVISSVEGKRVVFILGKHPALSLADAREAARQKRKAVALVGPEAAQADGAGTLAELIETYGKQRGAKQRAWDEAQRSIKRIFGSVMETRLIKLEKATLQRLVDRYPSANCAAHAVRALRPILKWAARRDLLTFDPAQLEQPVRKQTPRDRMLDEEELRRVWRALGVSPYDRAVRLLLLTACRKREITDGEWKEINFDTATWIIPKERMKPGTAHLVTLPQQAVSLLREIKQTAPKGRVFADTMTNWHKYQQQLFALSDTSGWHRHDLRRTAATHMARLGVQPHVVEAVLGHKFVVSKVAGIYNLYQYEKEKREALQLLADYYDTL